VTRLAGLLACLLLAACAPSGGEPAPGEVTVVKTGADVLRESGFARLQGLSVGLIANQTSRTGGRHLADWLSEDSGVELVALFGPEHGLRGDNDAGSTIEDGIDDKTGVPVYSLYGERRAPDPEVLSELDVLVFDIQDIGARFYTYIATMGLAMEAAARADVGFLILDRPNPLGGELVDGFVLEKEFESFVGPFPIPIQHGLTVGELARMVRGESWLPGLADLDLEVEKLQGWRRSLLWPETGLEWIPTSPNIPDFETALVYAGMCLVEATTVNEGRGTESPFLLVGAPDLDSRALVSQLDRARLSGIRFELAGYTPVSMPGKSTNPRHLREAVTGIRLEVTDARSLRPVQLGINVLSALSSVAGTGVLRPRGLSRLGGTDRLFEALSAGEPADSIVNMWAEDVAAFRALRAGYLLYD
jgi:uncharacterized protein YbbC (DUF1343 family)